MFKGEKIKNLRKQMNLTQSELAKKANMSRSYLGDVERDRYNPSIETLSDIASALGVDTSYFFNEDYKKNNKIPVFSAVSAGYPLLTNDEIVDYEEISEEIRTKGEYFGLKIKGSSMEPRYLEGDTLIVHQQSDVDSGDLAIVLINGDEATFKKVEKSSNGIMLIPLNPSYSPKFFTCEDIERLPVQIIGKVVELRGKL